MSNVIRKKIYQVRELLDHVEINHTKKDVIYLDGDKIKLGSDRYKTFKFKGLKCADPRCGLVGKFFAKERSAGSKIISYHMNLYALDENENEVLMTKDHIIPKSKGGKDLLENYQTMCTIHNCEKGDNI